MNETSHSENCAWLDGALHPIGLAQFVYDRDDLMAPWHVTSSDGAVDLTFTPEGRHVERLNLRLVATNFTQLFGRFDGDLRLGDRTVKVRDQYGFVEEQYAKW